MTQDDRASQLVAPGFDPVALELYPFLTSGASIHIVPGDVRGVTASLLAWIAEHRISVALLPTPIAELAIEHAWPAETQLRVLYTGGDKLHRGELHAPLAMASPPAALACCCASAGRGHGL